MDPTAAYDAAVEIVASWMDEKQPWLAKMKARAACEKLAKAGLLHDPRRVAALEAVAEAAQARRAAQTGTDRLCRSQDLHDALDALDAVPAPAAETTSGEQDLQFHCTHSTHEVAPLRCGGRHYGLPCGPGCAPVVS